MNSQSIPSDSKLSIEPLRLLEDNYAYLLRDQSSGKTAVVDPSEAGPVLKRLAALGWKLDYILNTHHHWDHTGGNREIKAATKCLVVGPLADRERIPEIDIEVSESTGFQLGDSTARVFDIPGHTKGHIAFWFSHCRALFSGDTLFSFGCGRMFEGSAGEMWSSLAKLRGLPDDTLLYCGHEYTQANLKFALSLEPDVPELLAKQNAVAATISQGKPSIPSLLGEEKRWNPFLRPDDSKLQKRLGLTTSGPVKVFAEIRRRKDQFQ